MKFDYDGATYTIEFTRNYRLIPNPNKEAGAPAKILTSYPDTSVLLWKRVGTEPGTLFSMATVGAYLHDKFSHEEGRRAALRKMSKGTTPVLDKDLKRAMWKCYMERGKA